MKLVTLVIPVINNFEGLAELLNSVRYPIYPIIIDNWRHNRGVSWAWNYGIDNAITDKVIISNDDIIFHENTIERLIEAADTYSIFGSSSGYACFIVNKDTFNLRFDEAFFPAYFEDNDMEYRAKLAGLKISTLNKDVAVTHKGSVSQFKGNLVPSQRFEELRAYYIKKWGGEPGYEKYTTPFNRGMV